MYIKQIIDNNIGPISNTHIIFPFSEDGYPKPVVLVGENGSGKSLLISNIVDSFYEIARKAYNDAVMPGEYGGTQYFKSISPSQVRIGENYMFSYIEYLDANFNEQDRRIDYIFKSGNISVEDFATISGIELNKKISWTDNNHKAVSTEKEQAESIFSNDVICYFGPNRYEKPNWMGAKYYALSDFEHLSINKRWSGQLRTPIRVENVTSSRYYKDPTFKVTKVI